MNKNTEKEYEYHNDVNTFNETLRNLDNFNFAGYGDTATGHGFAAEDYNTVADKLKFNNAKVIGGDNAKNGADRLVNGVEVQTKYLKTGRRSVEALFDNKGDGMYKYKDKNGNLMQSEVPYDQYDKAIETMENKIRAGKVEGVTDPTKAKELIRRGNLTYAQARNVAKAGNIDSLKYDAQAGAITATFSGGIAFAINLSMCLMSGQKIEEALESSIVAMGKASAVAFGSHIAVSQISKYLSSNFTKEGIKAPLVNYLKPILQKAGTKYGWIGTLSKTATLKAINTGVIALIMTIPDLYKGLISHSISKSNMVKNLGILGAGLGGGFGAATLATGIPGFGLMIAGGILASMGIKKLLDIFIEDDKQKMQPAFQKAVEQIAIDYMLSEHEMELFIVEIQHLSSQSSFWGDCHKQCHNSTNQEKAFYNYMYQSLDYVAEKIVKDRAPIKLDVIMHNHRIFNNAFAQVEIEQNKFTQQQKDRTDILTRLKKNENETQKLLDNF